MFLFVKIHELIEDELTIINNQYFIVNSKEEFIFFKKAMDRGFSKKYKYTEECEMNAAIVALENEDEEFKTILNDFEKVFFKIGTFQETISDEMIKSMNSLKLNKDSVKDAIASYQKKYFDESIIKQLSNSLSEIKEVKDFDENFIEPSNW